MANILPRDKQVQIVGALCEGMGVRPIERLFGVHRDTVTKLGRAVGEGCADLLDRRMHDLPGATWQADELWSYVFAHQRRVRPHHDPDRVGDQWVFFALCRETKCVPTFLVGKRTAANTATFIQDLASRLRNRIQISTDGFGPYERAILDAFSKDGVDYAKVVKEYEAEPMGPGRYAPPRVVSVDKTPVAGEPIAELVSTSHVENKNLGVRMQSRRFTRLTNGHSKKFENHVAAVALHLAHYNFVKIHSSIRCTPAMASGVTASVWSVADLVSAALDGVEL
jgi:IS1 family transposase